MDQAILSTSTGSSRIFLKDRKRGSRNDILLTVPKNHTGSCAVKYFSDFTGRKYLAILPTFKEASRVALYANNEVLGGYFDVEIAESFGRKITHTDFIDWMSDL